MVVVVGWGWGWGWGWWGGVGVGGVSSISYGHIQDKSNPQEREATTLMEHED